MTVISHSTLLNQILNGNKTQTIRPIHSDHWVSLDKGDKLQHYWKLRVSKDEKDTHFIGESEIKEVKRIRFHKGKDLPVMSKVEPKNPGDNEDRLIVDFKDEEAEEVAKLDGFNSYEEMINTWFMPTYGEELFNKDFAVIRYNWIELNK